MAIANALPSRAADSTTTTVYPSRTGSYGEAAILPYGNGMHGFGMEGTYYTATNATIASAITGHAAPVVADTDTKPFLFIYNGNSAKQLIIDFAFFSVAAAGTNGTSNYIAAYVDNKGSSAYTSGGTAITAFNKNNPAGPTSGVTMYAGAVVAAFTSSQRVLQQNVRTAIPVVGDTMTVKFGDPGSGITTALLDTSTGRTATYIPAGPVVVPPLGNFGITFIRASQTVAATYEFQIGWIER